MIPELYFSSKSLCSYWLEMIADSFIFFFLINGRFQAPICLCGRFQAPVSLCRRFQAPISLCCLILCHLFGHIVCMDDNAGAKRILLVSPQALADWRRQRGTWLSIVQQDLKHHLTLPRAADLAQNRPLWRMMSTYGATKSWSCIPEMTTIPIIPSHHPV